MKLLFTQDALVNAGAERSHLEIPLPGLCLPTGQAGPHRSEQGTQPTTVGSNVFVSKISDLGNGLWGHSPWLGGRYSQTLKNVS